MSNSEEHSKLIELIRQQEREELLQKIRDSQASIAEFHEAIDKLLAELSGAGEVLLQKIRDSQASIERSHGAIDKLLAEFDKRHAETRG